MKCYVLTTANEKKRQEHAQAEFTKIGIKPIFFQGIDGRIMSSARLGEISNNTAMLPGEVGCAASHLHILRAFLQSKEEAICIFEDDVCFSTTMTASLLSAMQTFISQQTSGAVLLLRKRKRLGKMIQSYQDIKIYECFHASGTIAYIINRKAAEIIINLNTPIRFQADNWKVFIATNEISLYALDNDLCFEWEEDGEYRSIVGKSSLRACHQSSHKKMVHQFLKSQGKTAFFEFKVLLKAYYYAWYRMITRR